MELFTPWYFHLLIVPIWWPFVCQVRSLHSSTCFNNLSDKLLWLNIVLTLAQVQIVSSPHCIWWRWLLLEQSCTATILQLTFSRTPLSRKWPFEIQPAQTFRLVLSDDNSRILSMSSYSSCTKIEYSKETLSNSGNPHWNCKFRSEWPILKSFLSKITHSGFGSQ